MAYTHPDRAYHNAGHIDAVLSRIDQLHDGDARERALARLAAYYHDVVYIPGSRLNEALSADVARLHLTRLGLDALDVGQIESAILATADHRCPDGGELETLLCDADLYELGTERFLANGYLVWLEYGQPAPDL